MKLITTKQRLRDVQRQRKETYKQRLAASKAKNRHYSTRKAPRQRPKRKKIDYSPLNDYIQDQVKRGLRHQLLKNRKKGIVIHLPEVMDFEENKKETLQHLNAISVLVSYIHKNHGQPLPKKTYNLVSVNFDNLRKLSAPAALALTAELSNWEDTIRNKLNPKIKQWNDEIYSQLHDLGFFNLFENKFVKPPKCKDNCSDTRLVRYIKGKCGDDGKIKELKRGIHDLVGEKQIDKWTFLASGLDEAITNVTHHAYPEGWDRRTKEKPWYMTGSYNETTRELKVIFYDQGVSIPKTLDNSKWKDGIFGLLTKIPAVDRRKDENLLEAAVEYGKTRTNEPDRGKGLGDLLVFIQQRKSGMLSILSGKGQYSFTLDNDKQKTTTSRSKYPVQGTLIIWRVTL
ncbi:hypothetical protein L4C39_04715 [Vibrio clamense]|uniref:hypothetical protein n=1 Tax=Vibrio clamense TaxID=2910254 RepID=UPI003D1D0792